MSGTDLTIFPRVRKLGIARSRPQELFARAQPKL